MMAETFGVIAYPNRDGAFDGEMILKTVVLSSSYNCCISKLKAQLEKQVKHWKAKAQETGEKP